MDRLPKIIFLVFFSLLLASCGGNGGNSNAGIVVDPVGEFMDDVIPVLDVSPGGIWVSQNLLGEPSSTIYIAENGKLMIEQFNFIFSSDPETVFNTLEGGYSRNGSGQIELSNPTEIRGRYQHSEIAIGEPIFALDNSNCELTGTLVERVSLNVSLSCTDASNVTNVEMLNFISSPDCLSVRGVACSASEAYNVPSSLDILAGNYSDPVWLSFPINPTSDAETASATLISISNTGLITGTLDNGIECGVNGSVSIIDENYNLYEIEWAFSDCTPDVAGQSGRQFNGFLLVLDNGPLFPASLKILMESEDSMVPDFLSSFLVEVL